MGDTEAIVLVSSLIIGGSAAVFMFEAHFKRKRMANQEAAATARQQRMDNPDFDGLEKHYGCALPASFRRMYQDRKLINSDNLLIGVPNPMDETDECYVAWFEPADRETAAGAWGGGGGLFPFADNGAGDAYLVDLHQPDPDVIYHLHETNARKPIGVTLSVFLTASRRSVPDA